jgi:CBS domain-containing protein
MLARAILERTAREVITTTIDVSIDSAMDTLIDNNIGCLPVLGDKGALIGIISDKDIFRKIHETGGNYHDLKVGEIMSTDLIVGLPEDDLEYIAGLMAKNWIRHIPIMDGKKLIGLISSRDVIKAEARRTEIENRYLRLYLDGMDSRDRSAD